jgi:uncharacterized repeat protein (TIGR03803 family)
MYVTSCKARVGRHLRRASLAAFLLSGAAVSTQAQSFSALYEFPQNGSLGSDISQMSMIQATDGNFYGTTYGGGDYTGESGGAGTIFRVTLSGQLTQLWAFGCDKNGNCPNGRSPEGGVVQAKDGNFYGTTAAGGTYGQGTVYKLTPQGVLTTLHSFCHSPNTCSPDDGAGPFGALIEASNGALYGTTTTGTAFKTTRSGTFTLLSALPGGSDSALMQVPGGDLYGTTVAGGANNEGTVFKMSLRGKVTTLYSFCAQQPHCADGAQPLAGLVQGANGDLYGTTSVGGTGSDYGTVFKITRNGAFTSLVSFQAGSTPANPFAPLILASDGTLYGTTLYGGQPANGFVFQIANDTLANVYPLTGVNGCVGGTPYGGLVQSTNGSFYGSDDSGACVDSGTLFAFSNNLGPFVQPIPTYGAPGAKIILQGSNLSGATRVSFHGTNAVFTVVSAGEIKATLPGGATSGEIKVFTPGGILKSNVVFKVVQ